MTREEYIREAQASFGALLREQLERCDNMRENACPTDFGALRKTVIGVIGGDGIGPLIVGSAEKVLKKLLAGEIAEGKVEIRRIGGLTIENRLQCGQTVPAEVLEAIKDCHVLLKGPTTTPKGGSGKDMESANVTLRRELDLFANVRPVCLPEKGIDWTFFRENTEGEYVLGSKGVALGDELCCDFKVTTDCGTRRIARAAYDFARANGKKRVTVVTKANIMKKTDGTFSRICHEVARDYPEIETEERYVDIMSAEMINEKLQSRFEVILSPNLYGDILTDEAAQLQGGVGTAGSANIGTKYAMFEAIHGSAPRMIEEGLGDYADPSSILRAAGMLLAHIGRVETANRLYAAMERASQSVRVTGDRGGAACAEYTEKLLSLL